MTPQTEAICKYAVPFNPAIDKLMPNLRNRNDGIQVRKITATKFAPTKTLMRIATMRCAKIARSEFITPPLKSNAPCTGASPGSSDWPRTGSFSNPTRTKPNNVPSVPNR